MTIIRTLVVTFAILFCSAQGWSAELDWSDMEEKRPPIGPKQIGLVKDGASLVVKVEEHPLNGSIETFEYLLARLDVFAAVADEVVPGMKGHKARELAPGVFFANDEGGIYGRIERTTASAGTRSFYGDGGCKVLFMTYTGSGVAELAFYERKGGESDGVAFVTLRFYAKLDDITARIMAGLMHVFVPKLLDRKVAMFFDSLDKVMGVVEDAPVEVGEILVAKGVFDEVGAEEFAARFAGREVVPAEGFAVKSVAKEVVLNE